jgi:anaerobic magnesium-protoporphyrin IX monomethyl ester cyclase
MAVSPTAASMIDHASIEAERLDALLVYIEAADAWWAYSRGFQLGLYYLAQHATDAGYAVKVDLLSSNDFVVERLLRLHKRHGFRILGFYVDHDNQWVVGRVAAALRRSRPELAIVIGGPQVSGAPESTLERIPGAACGVIGDGEEALVELLGLPTLSPSTLGICQGLVVRDDATILRTAPRAPIEPLDRLSIPRRRELTIDADHEIPAAMTTGRGCTGRCAFCYEGALPASQGKRLRLHSVQRCLDEFEYLSTEFDHSYITIQDDTFVADHKRLREFCRGLSARYGGRVKWFCEARADTITRQPDLLPMMVDAGLIRLQIGGESGSQQILDAYRKGVTLEQVRATAEAAQRAGLLSLFINFILGGAFETVETCGLTEQFAVELLRTAPGCVEVSKSFFTPYPGTPMALCPEQFGIVIVDPDVVTGMGDSHVFCRTPTLSRFEILALGHELDKTLNSEMERLAACLPWDAASRHFEAYHRWGLSTAWFETLSTSPALGTYMSSLHGGRAKRLSAIATDALDETVPMRMVQLTASKEDRFVVRSAAGDVVELDALSQTLIELASGKLTFAEIVDVVQRLSSAADVSYVRSSLLECFRHLDEERLVLWRPFTTDETAEQTAAQPLA